MEDDFRMIYANYPTVGSIKVFFFIRHEINKSPWHPPFTGGFVGVYDTLEFQLYTQLGAISIRCL